MSGPAETVVDTLQSAVMSCYPGPGHTNGYCEEQESSIMEHLFDCLHSLNVCCRVDGVTIATQAIMIKAVHVGEISWRPD